MKLLLAILMLFAAATASGQDDLRPGFTSQSWHVYLQQEADNPAETTIIFIDLLTGDEVSVATAGERHTLIDGAVLYFDPAERQVKLVKPDGLIRDHPYIVSSGADHRVDWVVSRDGRRIAWALSQKGSDGLLTTTVSLADAAGAEIQELLVYGPRQGIRLAPLAFADAGDAIYIEAHIEGAETGGGYLRRGGLFALHFGGGNVATSALPSERACFCAVGFGGDIMARLVAETETAGITLEIYELSSGRLRAVPPVSLGDYNEAGNILISPDDALAVYALSQVDALAGQGQKISTVIVLVDLRNARQMVVNYPMSALARPLSWTEDNSAILFTQEGLGGVWKMQVNNGQTIKVADSVYLGMIGAPSSE